MFAPFPLMAVLTDWTESRLRAISFFLLVLLLAGLAVRALWNRSAADWPRLPRIGYGRSLAIVAAWGLLCLVVLTMIATTREMMMPGSWQKVGLLYYAPPPAGATTPPADDREPAAVGLQIGRALVLGWFDFLRDRLARARGDRTAILYGLGITVLFAAAVDGFARWCLRARSDGAGPRRRWRFRWSLSILALVALLFATGYCAIGLARHLGWLLSG